MTQEEAIHSEASSRSWFVLAPSLRALSDFCQRVAVSLEAGIDLRKVVRDEALRTRSLLSSALAEISEAVEQGGSFADATARRGDCFPELFIVMVQVGETTGSTPEVFRRLARHYDHREKLRRRFLSGLAWPILQLLAALAVVGLLILVGGVLQGARGQGIDILGLGLTGFGGLFVYMNLLLGLAVGLSLAVVFIRKRAGLQSRILSWLNRAPVIGDCLRKIALARIAWALHLTMNVELDMRRVAELTLRCSGNPRFDKHANQCSSVIDSGKPLSIAFAQTEAFPKDFLDALIVAEQTGQISESMARLSARYEEEAEDALNTLATATGFIIWALIAMLVILLIFRVFGFYLGVLQDAVDLA